MSHTSHDKRLVELERSIRKHGLVTPIVVKRVKTRYHIVDGNARYMATNTETIDSMILGYKGIYKIPKKMITKRR